MRAPYQSEDDWTQNRYFFLCELTSAMNAKIKTNILAPWMLTSSAVSRVTLYFSGDTRVKKDSWRETWALDQQEHLFKSWARTNVYSRQPQALLHAGLSLTLPWRLGCPLATPPWTSCLLLSMRPPNSRPSYFSTAALPWFLPRRHHTRSARRSGASQVSYSDKAGYMPLR